MVASENINAIRNRSKRKWNNSIDRGHFRRTAVETRRFSLGYSRLFSQSLVRIKMKHLFLIVFFWRTKYRGNGSTSPDAKLKFKLRIQLNWPSDTENAKNKTILVFHWNECEFLISVSEDTILINYKVVILYFHIKTCEHLWDFKHLYRFKFQELQ